LAPFWHGLAVARTTCAQSLDRSAGLRYTKQHKHHARIANNNTIMGHHAHSLELVAIAIATFPIASLHWSIPLHREIEPRFLLEGHHHDV